MMSIAQPHETAAHRAEGNFETAVITVQGEHAMIEYVLFGPFTPAQELMLSSCNNKSTEDSEVLSFLAFLDPDAFAQRLSQRYGGREFSIPEENRGNVTKTFFSSNGISMGKKFPGQAKFQIEIRDV